MGHSSGFPAILNPSLIAAVRQQYRLNLEGIHGISHWARVLANGLHLAAFTAVNRDVIALFALFHDACRNNDASDPKHGERGAALATKLRGTYYELSELDMASLACACEHHTRGLTQTELVVQICWDADRLDLGRVMVGPSSVRLCTDTARSEDTSHECCAAARGQLFPFQDRWQPSPVSPANVRNQTL